MFKFNFNIEDDENSAVKPLQTVESLKESILPASIEVDEETGGWSYDELEKLRSTSTSTETHSFKKLYLNNDIYIEFLGHHQSDDKENGGHFDGGGGDDQLARITKTHDVLAGKYEGGLKVWELSIDLARFIYNLPEVDLTRADLSSLRNDLESVLEVVCEKNKKKDVTLLRVLELGCGHALPSLSLLKLIEKREDRDTQFKVQIYLQDFNKKVIEDITFENIRNYLKNRPSKSHIQLEINFLYGDWRHLHEQRHELLGQDNSFDLILTSETIYNTNNYPSLLNLFHSCLKTTPPSMVLLSAKTYYFGCGGNLHEFLTMARSEPQYAFRTSSDLLPLLHLLLTTTNNANGNNNEKEEVDTTISIRSTTTTTTTVAEAASFNSSINSAVNLSSSNNTTKISKEIIKIYFS